MKRFSIFTLFVLATASMFAQTARVQVIHNSADPAARQVDVYLNGGILLDDFKFRAASPFIDAPAGEEISVAIAPGTSESVADAIATFNYTLEEDETYVIVANGVLDPSSFGENPDGESTAFNLFVYAGAREAAEVDGNVDLLFFHGATDAPTVDGIARDVATIIDDATYGNFQGYVSVGAGKYLIDVTPGDDESTIVTTARAYLQGAGGAAGVVFASGFLSTDDEVEGSKSFKLMVALPDGTVRTLPLLNTALVQVIHNAADPAAAEVDVYLDGGLAIDDFAFRTATPYIEVPANVGIELAVAPGISESVAEALATFPANLKAGAAYTIIANGVLDPASFEANPDGASTGFTLWVREGALARSTSGSEVSFIGVHGATDAPAVDIIARDVATLLDDVSYGAVSDYITVPAGSYILDVAPGATPDDVLVSYAADLSGLGGGTAVVFASGFLSPDDEPDGAEGFGLWVTLADGLTFPLPLEDELTEEGELASRIAAFGTSVFPNPASETLHVSFNGAFDGMISLVSLDGRVISNTYFGTENGGVAAIDVQDIPSGMYYLTVNNGVSVETTPVSIQ